jgi:predicted nucleic acid-binding protein
MPRLAVCNTSPLQYLYQIDQIDLLPRFYTEVIIPPAVQRELTVGRSIGVSLPDIAGLCWIHMCAPTQVQPFALATTLGDGEREALALAVETPDSLLIMDDGLARRVGRLLGLTMTGTVSILARAKREGLIPQLAPMLEQLEDLGFRLSVEAKATALRLVGEGS